MSCNIEWNCPPGSFPYTVSPGDTLYMLAKRFETSVQRLQEINSIENPNVLNIGDTLCIPEPLQYFPTCKTSNYYVVQNGDTIFTIASYFGVSTAQIMYSNIGIDENNLYEGMILCIPLAPPKLCVSINGNILTLLYNSGDKAQFPCRNTLKDFSSQVVQKQIDTSFGGRKRLNLLVPDTAISSLSAQKSDRDIILADNDMDKVFNLVPVGTGVEIN